MGAVLVPGDIVQAPRLNPKPEEIVKRLSKQNCIELKEGGITFLSDRILITMPLERASVHHLQPSSRWLKILNTTLKWTMQW